MNRLALVLAAATLACALSAPAAPVRPAAADDPLVVYFRVEGPADESTFAETGEYQAIWAGYVTVPTEVYIDTVTGNTWHLYVNASDRYTAECTAGPRMGQSYDRGPADQSTGATSVLAALHQASVQGGFAYEVSDNWFPGMGFFVSSIGEHTGSGAVGWNYRVWNPTDAYMSSLACDLFLLGYDSSPPPLPHEQVLWHWGAPGSVYPLKVTADKATVGVGEEFTAAVSAYQTQDWNGMGSWQPLAGATVTVEVGDVAVETLTTDDNGEANGYLDSEGTYQLAASKGRDGGTYYIPSDSRTAVSVSGGDASNWWTQSTQAEFASGAAFQVDSAVSPGDVRLARGGTVSEDYILDGGTATLGGEHFFDNFRIINGATLNVPQGEVLRVHANYIEVDVTSTINADGRGYAGGAGDTEYGYDGGGMGGGSRGEHAGGYGGGGGGAAHGGPAGKGGQGDLGDPPIAPGGAAGLQYGKACTTGDDTFFLGSGGGGGAGNGSAAGGDGGNGGGAVVLEGMSLGAGTSVVINGIITADGDDASDGMTAGCGGGGGGSGGTILIKGKDIQIADDVLGVEGGDGGNWGGSQVGEGGGGGGGGYGRIKVFYESCNESSGHSNAGGAGGSGGGYPCDGQDALTGLDSGKSRWEYQVLSPVLPYHDSGTLTSSAHDMGYEADFGKLRWCAATPAGTEVKFQIAANSDNATWDFVGPDGAANTYYTTSGTDIWSGHDGDRYIRYKAFLATSAAGKTPTLSRVSITGSPPAAVGGIAELPEFVEGAGSAAGDCIALAGLAAAAAAALGGGAWYARGR